VAANLVSQTYTTTVAGKSYSASVQESNGEYVISVPNLPGATATASTAQAAENALTIKIDVLA
jgi:predicted RNase H-like HicB family nuclease